MARLKPEQLGEIVAVARANAGAPYAANPCRELHAAILDLVAQVEKSNGFSSAPAPSAARLKPIEIVMATQIHRDMELRGVTHLDQKCILDLADALDAERKARREAEALLRAICTEADKEAETSWAAEDLLTKATEYLARAGGEELP